jgi:hypothetical protein
MDTDRLFEIFDTCIELAESAPPDRRALLIGVAEQILRQANEFIEAAYPKHGALQNAPTSTVLQ